MKKHAAWTIAALLTGAALAQQAPPATPAAPALPTLGELVRTNPELSTLRTALEAAGLLTELDNTEGFRRTLFAPTNAAFARIPAADLQALLNNREALTRILTGHLALGALPSFALSDGARIQAINDVLWTVEVENDMAMLGGAGVTQADIQASNGVVHLIDTVLMPMEEDDAEEEAAPAAPAGG